MYKRQCRDRGPGRHLAPLCGDEHVGHDRSPTLDGSLAADWRFYSQTGLLDCLLYTSKRAAIVDAGSGETVSGGEQEGEPAAQTETDDADASIAARLSEKPASGGFYVIEGGTGPGRQIADHLPDADEPAALIVEVRRNCEDVYKRQMPSFVAAPRRWAVIWISALAAAIRPSHSTLSLIHISARSLPAAF